MVTFFADGEPVFQPLSQLGLRYAAPTSRESRTFWYEGGRGQISDDEVCRRAGCTLRELKQWEAAADDEAEAFGRANEGDW